MTGKTTIVAALSLAATALGPMAAAQGEERPAQTAPSPNQQPAALVNPLAGQPFDRLSDTRERPLFSPSRRPPPPPPEIVRVPEPPPPPPPPPNVALLGIVMDGEEARALVRTGPASKIMRARIGDDIGGWKVAQIEGRRLVLSLDGRLAAFTMFSGDRAKDATAPVSSPRPTNAQDSGPSPQRDISQSQTQRSASQSQGSRPSAARRQRKTQQ